MIEFFLSIFPQYAVLRYQVDALRLERESLMREIDGAHARIDDLQRVADAMAMRATGRRIFNAAPDEAMPPTVENSAAIPSRTFARDLVRKGLDDFNEKMRKLA
jgi:hypothetical protein